jgi:protocatechuate 3,4-dioxygenase beta subunit
MPSLAALLLVALAATPTRDGAATYPTERVEIAGRVLDARGAPLRDAGIFVIGRNDVGIDLRHIQTWRHWAFTSRTNSQGTFRVRAAPGAAFVLAVHEANRRSVQARAVPIDAASSMRGVRLQFGGDAEITGLVVDADGNPVPGVSVSAYPEPAPNAPEGGASFGVGVSGDDGAFRITGLHRGGYRVFASGRGLWCECIGFDGQPVRTGERGLVLPVIKSGVIRGRVVEAADDGRIIPAERFVVETPATRGWIFDSADGAFEVPVFRPWFELPILVWSKGSRTLAFSTFQVSLQQGEERDLGEIVLSPGRTVRGRVVDQAGKPIEGVALNPGFEKYATATPLGTTDAAGRFVLNGLEERDASVRLFHPRYRRTQYVIRADVDEVEIRLETASSARVRVEDVDGTPLRGAYIHAISPRGNGTCVSDDDGMCVIGGLAPGNYALNLSGVRGVGVPRPQPWQLRVRVPADRPGEGRFRYPRRPSRLRVHVLMPDGTFANASVVILPEKITTREPLRDREGVRVPHYGTGVDLEHPVTNLPPDRYTVLATGDAHGMCGRVTVDLREGADEVVTVRLAPDPGGCTAP